MNSVDSVSSPVRDYGNFDPLKETSNYLNTCLCGCAVNKTNIVYGIPRPAQLGLDENAEIEIRRFFVQCPSCGSLGPATKMAVYAVLQWNLSLLCNKPNYTEIPLFGISGLTKLEASAKLHAIRADLKKRLDECTERLKLTDTTKHPGPRYHAKLGAYYAWSFYAMHLISDNHFFRSNPNGVKGSCSQQTT